MPAPIADCGRGVSRAVRIDRSFYKDDDYEGLLEMRLVAGRSLAAPRPARDPLKGWTFQTFDDFAPPRDRHHYRLDDAITADYQDFIRKNKFFLMDTVTRFFEDGTGPRAIEFEGYAIIYDYQNKRLKVIRYDRRRYPC